MRLRPGPRAFWFVRHGQSEGNVIRDAAEADHAERYDLGTRDADVPLSDLGRRQARAVGRWLRDSPAEARPTVVLASPYLRTRQTAELLLDAAGDALRGVPLEVDERLRDREMGMWDGLTWRGIRAAHPDEAARALVVGRYYHRPPGGESWVDIMLRLRSVLGDAARGWPGERVLVVSHDVTIQLCRCLLEGLDEEATVRLLTSVSYANCALSTFEAERDGYRATRYNTVVPVQEHGEPVTEEPDATAPR